MILDSTRIVSTTCPSVNSMTRIFIDLQFRQSNVWGDQNLTDEMRNAIHGQPIEIHDNGVAVDLSTL